MELPSYELRSRSRSNTPFLRSSCDHENCMGGDDHSHLGGRKTPIKKNKLPATNAAKTSEPIIEEDESSHHSHRTRQVTRNIRNRLSTDGLSDSPELIGDLRKEIAQNNINSRYEYERVSGQYEHGTLADVSLSPIRTSHSRSSYNASRERSRYSPAYSACSTDSLFAEQALQDVSALVESDPEHNLEHLPFRLYKISGEYWNKYPKTDYTYSPVSKDRVELAPGQIAVPNMSRRSLKNFKMYGPNSSLDELDDIVKQNSWTSSNLRKRMVAAESSDDEETYRRHLADNDDRWWLTSVIMSLITSITTTTRDAYRNVVGTKKGYPYTNLPRRQGILSQSASVLAAPFIWIYSITKTIITTTITTITETISPTIEPAYRSSQYKAVEKKKRRLWPWFLLLLLPIIGYGSYYTYENYDDMVMPNFDDFKLDLSEFSAISMPEISKMIPEMNLTLPKIAENLPKAYNEYKDIVHNRMSDASDYVKVVANSCYEEMGRFWRGVVG